jgi:hypothetical protein
MHCSQVLAFVLGSSLLAPLSPPARSQDQACHHLFTLPGQSVGERPGAALAELGDVDGDGVSDFAVGAPAAPLVDPDGRSQPAGMVRVYSGASGLLLQSFSAQVAYERYGAALAGVGDADGDGLADLAIGAPLAAGARGRIELRSAASGALLWSLLGAEDGEQLGAALAAVGDLDGDGVAELAVGATGASQGGFLAGAVRLLAGSSGVQLWRLEGQPFEQLGSALAGGADVDGDGIPDLAIGSPFGDEAAFNAGRVDLRRGSDGAWINSLLGQASGELFGYEVKLVTDASGDGRADVLAVAPSADGTGLDSGVARLMAGLSSQQLLQLSGPAAASYASSAAPIGDVDQDGHGDYALGVAAGGSSEAGLVRCFSGHSGSLLLEFSGAEAWDWFGAKLLPLSDVSGDGSPELLIAAPGHDDYAPLGYVRVVSPRDLNLASDVHLLDPAAGGSANLRLNFGAANAGVPYLLLASATPTGSGLPLGALLLPLNPDALTLWTLLHPNQAPWQNSSALLNSQGQGEARLELAPGQAQLAGLSLRQAAVLLGSAGLSAVSRAVPLQL